MEHWDSGSGRGWIFGGEQRHCLLLQEHRPYIELEDWKTWLKGKD